MSWSYYPSGSARSTRAGIKAKNTRGSFGRTRWGIAWEELLGGGSRVSKARTYARKGQVIELTIDPGRVGARIQGSRKKPYDGSIEIETFTVPQRTELIEALAQRAALVIELLDGALPQQVDEIAREITGASLIPESAEKLTFRCSCPDWGNPCKHVAAVHLLVTEQIDEDPTLIFLLRGFDRDELRECLLGRAAPAASSTRREEEQEASMLAVEEHEEEELALSLDPQAFWGRGMEPFEMEGRVLCASSDGEILEELGDLPLWQAEGSLRELLVCVYRAAGQRGLELLGEASASSPGEEN